MLNETSAQVDLASESGFTMTDTNPTPEPESYIVESRYGQLTFGPEQVLTMGRSILGFPHLTQFGLARMPGHDGQNLLLLQSLEDADVAFPCLSLDIANPMIDEADLKAVHDQLAITPENGATLCILTARDEGEGKSAVTINLRAPVFVDSARRMAWQIVLNNPRYPIRHGL